MHYETLFSARALQLTDSFQHKLGYLVGNLYSRIGTEDWVPENCSLDDFDRLRREPVENQDMILWIEKPIYKAVISKLKTVESPSLENLQQIVQQTKITQENRKQQALKAVSEVMSEYGVETPALEKLLRRLENRPDFQTAFK